MSILNDIMKEEYERMNRLIPRIEAEIKELPKGYISEKKIKGGTYYYLQYRENKKMKSVYLKQKDVEAYRTLVAHRKELEKKLKELQQEQKKLERILKQGNDYEYTGNKATKTAQEL